MSRIDAVFEKLKSDEKKAFVAFITAGDPTLDVTKTLCFMMEKSLLFSPLVIFPPV